jgi:hypothetical protein
MCKLSRKDGYKIDKIVFTFSESDMIDDNTEVENLKEANKLIRKASYFAPESGAYNKTDFVIHFANGEMYKGRYDIVYGDIADLKKHVTRNLKYVASGKNPYASDKQIREAKELLSYSDQWE